ncbi:L-aspartate oxidase [Solemya pervernicosa gill symbiont]|uniref:L-aspartate oxidase n=2 Tax=Gammaproteobacteria incertae sedis TaxID=118884 RepID=A0A1T2L0H6_9GAMM|nr:FAD-dependent oxidoreductase [Candidatus Reidiella endopervernicosa]OOZ38582.1 L-aspartate oxidase [Solemya pervernicosa gill symbiont]QKQ26944.1 FAD-binding protein [Candidatus Reidiella endopervernicosa]
MSKGTPYKEALARFQQVHGTAHELPDTSVDVDALLRDHHPDHLGGSIVDLEVGANRGERCHRQLADMLQSNARIDEADLAGAKTVETDVLIIGGGGAGCAAALTAAKEGARVILTTKLRLGDSNTVMAEGGIQASIDKDDTPQIHYDDTLRGGHNLADKDLVAKMVLDGPDVIRWLIKQGMQFDVDEFGDLLTRRAGGTTADRVVYFRDYTGLEMMRVLRESVLNREIEVWHYSPAVELLSDEQGHCAGAVITDLKKRRNVLVKAKSVIMATGGIGRMHLNAFPTSNHFGATGDGLVLTYRLGAQLRDLDSFQYHPSGLAYPHHLAGTLITEGVRSAGAQMINAEGQRFVDELKPRDHVSSAIIRECAEGRGVDAGESGIGIWLDTPGLDLRNPGIINKRFPKLVQLGKKSGIDPAKTPLLIYPTLHYQNGGVVIDENGQTTVPNLYCVGEVSGGLHGKNRMMGNALLEIISFGRRAGHVAAQSGYQRRHNKVSIAHLGPMQRDLTLAKMPMDLQGPMLFPDYAKFDSDAEYEGLRKTRNREEE